MNPPQKYIEGSKFLHYFKHSSRFPFKELKEWTKNQSVKIKSERRKELPAVEGLPEEFDSDCWSVDTRLEFHIDCSSC